jgi:hypothetical protein
MVRRRRAFLRSRRLFFIRVQSFTSYLVSQTLVLSQNPPLPSIP